jgi:hypothetical protein
MILMCASLNARHYGLRARRRPWKPKARASAPSLPPTITSTGETMSKPIQERAELRRLAATTQDPGSRCHWRPWGDLVAAFVGGMVAAAIVVAPIAVIIAFDLLVPGRGALP